MELYLENPMFIILLTTGIVFVFVGAIMWFFPPKKINSLYGYRSSNSMSSQEKWDFAQKYSTMVVLKFGLILIFSSMIGLLIEMGENVGTVIAISMVILSAVMLIYKTENALKNKFGK